MYLELLVIQKHKNIVDNRGTGKHFTEDNFKKNRKIRFYRETLMAFYSNERLF
jgi:hypothetical protein